MFLEQIKEKETLNTFVSNSRDGQFLQTWEWGEFQKSLGRQIWRVGVYKSAGELRAVATIVSHPLPFGLSYLYCPYGPVFLNDSSTPQREEIIKLVLTKLRSITVETKNYLEIFARIEPRIEWEQIGNFFQNLKIKKTTAVQPQDTQIINLKTTPEELLKQMHSKTRYNIRLAEKKGVKIREAREKSDFEIFWKLMQITTKRDGFHSHEKSYYESLWQSFYTTSNNNMNLSVKILLAESDDKPVAAIMLGLFGTKAVYLHGVSDHKYRSLMAPHLLQYEAMKLAQSSGMTDYDMWGIKPTNRHLDNKSKEDRWTGITRFKKGFGGAEVNYAGAWDYVYDKKLYLLYKLVRKFRRII